MDYQIISTARRYYSFIMKIGIKVIIFTISSACSQVNNGLHENMCELVLGPSHPEYFLILNGLYNYIHVAYTVLYLQKYITYNILY